jgi:branched-subunit amino acid ABC-type transport system permease component
LIIIVLVVKPTGLFGSKFEGRVWVWKNL